MSDPEKPPTESKPTLKNPLLNRRPKPRPKTCCIVNCGKTFVALSPAAKYCSPECAQVALKEAVERQRQRRIKAREERLAKDAMPKPSTGDGLA